MALKGSAFATRQNYLRGIKILIEYYQRLPEDCTVDEIKSYLVYQREQLNIASSTLNVRVCSLKYYFRHIANRLDLVVKIPNPRVQKFDTEIFTPAEMKIIFKTCRDVRQLLIIQLLFDCGLRIGEVIKLRASDFDKTCHTITIRNSKGNKTRVVFYGTSLKQTLNQYAKAIGIKQAYSPVSRFPHLKVSRTFILRNRSFIQSYKDSGKPLSISGIQHIIKRIIRRANLSKRGSAHTLRHTFAVHYLNRGGSIFSLQLLLGHSHISTTLGYLKYAKLPDGDRISVLDRLDQ